ncbi:hypothetical protein BH23ACT2_BH23ACT2_19780 [soil metagenome]
MATSSSAKKVARVAAKTSGGAKGAKGANWLFPVAIVAIFVLGISVVVYARGESGGGFDTTEPPRAQLAQGEAFDHWHAAFAVSICGEELEPFSDEGVDALGIHTHSDGLVHIHPFATRASGPRATMERYFDQVGLDVTDDAVSLPESFGYPDGDLFRAGAVGSEEGVTSCGGEDTELVLAHWEDAVTAGTTEPDEVVTGDFGSVQFTEDLGAFTLALRPVGSDEIIAPSSAADIVALGQVDGGGTPEDAPAVADGDGGDISDLEDVEGVEDLPIEEVPGEEVPGEEAPGDGGGDDTPGDAG